MGGVYSLMKDKWIKKAEKVDFEPDEKLIAEKGKTKGTMVTMAGGKGMKKGGYC
jgi:hypothetical protein